MPARLTFVIGRGPFNKSTMDPVIAELTSRGCAVTLYEGGEEVRKKDALREADLLVCPGQFKVTRELMAASPNLRGVISTAIGTDGYDEKAATELTIAVANAHAWQHVTGMAEATILLMLACLKDMTGDLERLRTNASKEFKKNTGILLHGRTVGIIGLGQTGRAVATRLAPWGVTILAAAPRLREPPPVGVTVVPLDELLRRSDIVSIHANLHAETHHLLDADRLAVMKRGAILINTARGAIVDEAALVEALRSGQIGRAGLDVFEKEPLPLESPLRTMPQVTLTPHTIGHSLEAQAAFPTVTIENAVRMACGELPLHHRNVDVAAAWLAKWSSRKLL